MNAPFKNIVQHLFHQPSLHSVTIDELSRMVSRYPSFAAAQFLLLKKMQDSKDPAFQSQLQKTALYFHNPLWLQFLLQTNLSPDESPALIQEEIPVLIADEPEVILNTPEPEQEVETKESVAAETPSETEEELPLADEDAALETRLEDIPHVAFDVSKSRVSAREPETEMLFEPYHTVDYFASQGIRIDKTEENPQDRLGKQLKSFTGWLKSMKKLPQASVEKILAENEESAVVSAAAHSVEQKEVITEAMAEVFRKQGLTEKAADVYRKLSLLNPSKSHYFAARIEELKH